MTSAGRGPGPPLAPRRGDATATVDHRLPDGRTIAVPLSMGAADDARLATVMLTRDDHRQPLRKERIAEAISGALCDLSVNTDVVAVQKYHKDKNIICVRLGSSSAAEALIAKKSVSVPAGPNDETNVVCSFSQYGIRMVRIELKRIPIIASADEVVAVVEKIGEVHRISRPLVHGFEDSVVILHVIPFIGVDMEAEQKVPFRPAIFSGQSSTVEYRCLDETVVCKACGEIGHRNGTNCPVRNKCFKCGMDGHIRRDCPTSGRKRHQGANAFPDREEEEHTVQTKPVAPAPPPADPKSLQSTGLPPLLPEGPTLWSDFSGISKESSIDRSRSPLSKSSSETSSAEQQKTKLSKQSKQDYEEKKDYVKRAAEKRAGELGIKRVKFSAKELSCIRNTSADDPHDNAGNNNANNNIPQCDGPIDSPVHLKEEPVTDATTDINDEEGGSDVSFEQDTEVDEYDHDELQNLCFGLDDYVSENEADIIQKNDAKKARLKEQLLAAQQRRNDQRRASRARCLKASVMRVPPQLLDHRLDWETHIHGLPDCSWPAQVSDMIALGLMAEDDSNPTALTCKDCNRTWHMLVTDEQDEAIFEPPHVLCEKQGLVCLKGHTNCMPSIE